MKVELVDLAKEPQFNPRASPLAFPSGTKLKVTVSSYKDLGTHEGVNLFNEVKFCPIDGGERLLQWPRIYYHDVGLGIYSPHSPEMDRYRELTAALSAGSPYVYHVYFDYKSRDQISDATKKIEIRAYDLSKEPRDVCLRFAGGVMFGGGFVSNTVIIPKESIRRALQTGG
jgi:hypothetical protein